MGGGRTSATATAEKQMRGQQPAGGPAAVAGGRRTPAAPASAAAAAAADWWAAGLAEFGIRPAEVRETFARAAGPGGQHVNKVATAVSLRWREIAVVARERRSQAMNRTIARRRFLALLAARREQARLARQARRAKARRANAPRPAGLQAAILAAKRRRGATKKLRARPGADD